ncbi:MAG: aminotransferase class V-fold PLP-dependent enzyme [Chloroflexota bacterium]|nr:aminotransferase class V-fold PLP-dependent enzyme [Chloroflexota bacterium]
MTNDDEVPKVCGPGDVNRRQFLVRAGIALGAGAFTAVPPRAPGVSAQRTDVGGWRTVRDQFALTRDLIHMSGFFLASHPKSVRDAIEAHRRGLDTDPVGYYWANNDRYLVAVLRTAADYLGTDPTDIALTDSTTMGLGLLYGGLQLRAGQEILTTTHDHYATAGSLRLRAERTDSSVRAIPLYDDPAAASQAGIVERLAGAVRPETRVVAVTWVHSGTGVKLPLPEIAGVLAELNADRDEDDRALLCVDGVHGLGIEAVRLPDLGCDFFVAGCHKWLYGPRGTGLIWGAPTAWPAATATIPTFDAGAYRGLAEGQASPGVPLAAQMTPGGFHSFEHRWALDQAFRFHLSVGKGEIARRIHELNRRLKDGLSAQSHVRLRTPMADDLSAGIVCFEVDGLSPEEVVARLRERRIVASVTPYVTRYARLAPSLLTSPEEVDETLRAVGELGRG